MDTNEIRRNRYAQMPKEQKNKLLQRRREQREELKVQKKSCYANMPHDKKIRLLQRRRELYAQNKKKKQETACESFVSKTQEKECRISDKTYITTTGAGRVEIGVFFHENAMDHPDGREAVNEEILHSKEVDYGDSLADVFDGLSTQLGSSSEIYQVRQCSSSSIPLSIDRHISSEGHIPEESTHSITFSTAQLPMNDVVHYAEINARLVNTGKRRKTNDNRLSRFKAIPDECFRLASVPECEHCGAKRFYLEPPNFCCSGGEVSLVNHEMPYDLRRLFSNVDEEGAEFRRNARTYNNSLAFTSLGAKYDTELTKNIKGVYTFRVQGQMYHFLNGLNPSGDAPSGVQMYFYDTEEELSKRLNASPKLCESTVKLLMGILRENPYTKFFKGLRDIPNIDEQKIVLNSNPGLDQRVYNLPSSSQVAAIWTESDDAAVDKSAHIQVYSHSNTSHRIKHYFACYDSLQYPLLFPRGESGWHHGILRKSKSKKRKNAETSVESDIDLNSVQTSHELIDLENIAAENGRKKPGVLSAREYYCYKFQMRDDDLSMLLHTGRLLQQFIVDIYVKIETSRLDFHRKNQNDIRTEILQGVVDSVSLGETQGSNIGRRVYLPASFIGGPRDMRRRYMDAMALVQKYGKPDLFITMTCNPMWKEIQDNLKYKEEAQDRPDLVSRVFRAKLEVLKSELLKKKFFGEVAACVYVVEFQKRGLPHAHILLILKPEFKLSNPEDYDNIVSAEIPDPTTQPYLYSLVIKHMMHGPCGSMNMQNPCMKNGVCKNKYPKDFTEYTSHAEDGYPHYRRRKNGPIVRVRGHCLDNRWVVPYNPYLLSMFDCHLNVEICSTIKLVKYLYKYVYKGYDLVSFYILSQDKTEDIDEIKNFQSGRWVAAAEAVWRIYRFNMYEMTPSVYTLQLHLPGQQIISFHKNSNLSKLVENGDISKTMLTEFFTMNQTNDKARSLNCFYREFPEYFVWNSKIKIWTERRKRKVIGRIVVVSPNEGERYYLRLLLSHIRAPKSFEDLLTVNGCQLSSYRDAALHLGFLESDSYIEDTLDEAAVFQMPSSLRSLFAVLLVFCLPTNPRLLWEKFQPDLCRDFERSLSTAQYSSEQIKRKALEGINQTLELMGANINDYQLIAEKFQLSSFERITKEIDSEKNVPFSEEDLLMSSKLNNGQKNAYDTIIAQVFSGIGQGFFIDGPGGTGKTFLYCALLATLRSQGHIAIAVASSGVAASILPGGRTAHSRFKIPLDMSENKACQISKQSSVARLIILAKLILWDEASMARRETIEAFDLLLRDVMNSDVPFGGKVVVFGGDFRQTLPVIQNASKDMQIEKSFVMSPLWRTLQNLKLTENMRAILDPLYSNFLLKIGEGSEPKNDNGNISLCKDMLIPYDNKDSSLKRLIQSVFCDLHLYSKDPYKMINRCILSAKNSSVDDVNELIINQFPGKTHVYTSMDRTIDERYQGDYEDFLNSLNPKGLPPHKLILKVNCPIILLRNLNPTEGLCNGTRLICRELKSYTICAEIAVGHHKGKRVFLPKIPLQSSDSEKNGVPFKRTQFPVRLCFSMTINKAQGQTLDYVGVYLREPVFSHGQLYVALSRAKTSDSVKVLIVPPNFGDDSVVCETKNVVYDEILELSKQMENILLIEDIKPGMTAWTAKVTVQERLQMTPSSKNKTTYQKFVLVDSQGSKVQGIIFNQAIPIMAPKLKLYKKCMISNAEVRKIPEKYQYDGIEMQWVISNQTVVEELPDEQDDQLPVEFTYTAFGDLAQFADSKTWTVDILAVVVDALAIYPVKKDNNTSYVQRFVLLNEEMQPIMLSLWNSFIENEARTLTQQIGKFPVIICRRLKVVSYNGIALSTRNDSVILIDPPKREARQLKNWAIRNENTLADLIDKKEYTKQNPKLFYQQREKITLVADVMATQKSAWVKVMLSFENIFQKYWYMACSKCYRATSANYLFPFTCNHCNEKQEAAPRCRFDVDLTDESGTITASVFAELGETLLGFTAVEAMESFNQGKELPLKNLHEELKTKIFIVHVKPAKSRDSDSHQRYTLNCFFEHAEGEKSLEKLTDQPSDFDISASTENQMAAIETSERVSSKARLCLQSRFDDETTAAENAETDLSEKGEDQKKKRTKLM